MDDAEGSGRSDVFAARVSSAVSRFGAGAVPAGFLYNGALSTYEQLGFKRDRMIGKHRWVVVRNVESSR